MGAGCVEEPLRVKILPDVDRYFQIRASLKDEDRVGMLLFLIQNVDVFAWSPYEVPRVDPEFIVHRLNVDPLFPPKKQKPRRSAKQHVEAVKLEVKRLREARAIREIFFPEWLANIVVVKKKNGKWRVYGFHRSKPSMPKRSISYAEDRSVSRHHIRTPKDEFPGRFSRVSSDCPSSQGPRKDSIHLLGSQLSLYYDAFWVEKRRGHVPTDDDENVPR